MSNPSRIFVVLHVLLWIALGVVSLEARPAAVVDRLDIKGRVVLVPAPQGLANLFGSSGVPAMLATRDWKLVYGPPSAAATMTTDPERGFDRANSALVIVPDRLNMPEDRENQASFRQYYQATQRRDMTKHTSFSDSVRRACPIRRGDRRQSPPTVPTSVQYLRPIRVGEKAIGGLGLGPDERSQPGAGSAEIVATGQLLVRGRRLGFVYGRTRTPTCDEIDAVERDARAWLEAILAANR